MHDDEKTLQFSVPTARERREWLRAFYFGGCMCPSLAPSLASLPALEDDDTVEALLSPDSGGEGLSREQKQRDPEYQLWRDFLFLRRRMRQEISDAFAGLHLDDASFRTFERALVSDARSDTYNEEQQQLLQEKIVQYMTQQSQEDGDGTLDGKAADESSHAENVESAASLGLQARALRATSYVAGMENEDYNGESDPQLALNLAQQSAKLSMFMENILRDAHSPIGELFSRYTNYFRRIYEKAAAVRRLRTSSSGHLSPQVPIRSRNTSSPPGAASTSSASNTSLTLSTSDSTSDFTAPALPAPLFIPSSPVNHRRHLVLPETPRPEGLWEQLFNEGSAEPPSPNTQSSTFARANLFPAATSAITSTPPPILPLIDSARIAGAFPFAKHLTKVLASAQEDIRSFLSHLGILLCSDAVIGTNTPLLPASQIQRIVYEAASQTLFAAIYDSLFSLYLRQSAAQDALLEKRCAEFKVRHLL